MEYTPLLLQLRLLADQQGDNRSLVAIAAQFERESADLIESLAVSLRCKAHCRNAA